MIKGPLADTSLAVARNVAREAAWDGLNNRRISTAVQDEAIHGAAELFEEVAKILRQEARARKP